VTALISGNGPVSLAMTSTSTTATVVSRESTNDPQLVITFGAP
jgi:hypothetical protein